MSENGNAQEAHTPENPYQCTEYNLQASFSEDNAQNEEYMEYCQQAITMIRAYSDQGDLAVVDCFGPDDRTYPVIAAIVTHEGQKAILPIARIFTDEDKASDNYIPVIAAKAAH